jgi:hypothetical protein
VDGFENVMTWRKNVSDVRKARLAEATDG